MLGRAIYRCLRPLSDHLPHSLWDRIVFLVFCVYVVVLFRALFGLGAPPSLPVDVSCVTVATPAESSNFSEPTPAVIFHEDHSGQSGVQAVNPAVSFTSLPAIQKATSDDQLPLLIQEDKGIPSQPIQDKPAQIELDGNAGGAQSVMSKEGVEAFRYQPDQPAASGTQSDNEECVE